MKFNLQMGMEREEGGDSKVGVENLGGKRSFLEVCTRAVLKALCMTGMEDKIVKNYVQEQYLLKCK